MTELAIRMGREGSGPSKENGPECFVSGTLVKTSGGLIPIERVTVGMLAWALDVETGEWGFREIVNTFESRSGDFLVRVEAGGGALTVTPVHPFWALDGTSTHSGEWSGAAELGIGDLLLSSEGEPVAVTAVSESAGGVAVHNFEVRDAHTYFVGSRGVLVHNACDESLTGDNGGGSAAGRGSFIDDMAPDEAARYQKYWEKRAPEGSSPYDVRRRYTEDGQVKQVTTYDEYGDRHRQYDLIDPRRSEHQRNFEYGPELPRPKGSRSDHLPINEK